MTTDTSERGLERLICTALTGHPCDPPEAYTAGLAPASYGGVGWICGNSHDYDREYCLDLAQLAAFVNATRPGAAESLSLNEDGPTRRKFLARLQGEITKRGTIEVLRHGIRHGAHDLDLFHGTPSPGNEKAGVRFDLNRFTVTRQLRYSRDETQLALDMVLFINGLPVFTFELKNNLTKQTVADAVWQYKKDRNPREKLFEFGRCLAHFALDESEIRFCTHLKGKASWFLPFNRGWNDGAGNPPNPHGCKTDYLWREVLTRESLTDIIENYAQVVESKDDRTGRKKRTQIWPRYHQLDVVRKLLADVGRHGAGRRYLIQHSAGSGKSNSIAWLAHQLIGRAKDDATVFDSIIVVTDRILLDRQIRDTIKQYAQVGATVGHAERSGDLRRFIEQGKKIIISTVQKFPFILSEIGSEHRGRTFAIIIDEAHSSQGGRASAAMAQALSEAGEVGEEETFEDQINRLMESRKLLPNAGYFAFTATPKNKTLEIFGAPAPRADGTVQHHAFHTYTMKQAIQEGFVLDVLAHYTPVASYYKLAKTVAEDPEFDVKKARKKLRRFVEGHDHAIRLKAEIMVDHFHEQVLAQGKIGGQARAMVVTNGIERAIQYYHAIGDYLKERKSRIEALVAFSGENEYGGTKVSEASLNGFPSGQIAAKFKEEPYRFLVCADKFQTGYDEPLLHTMYVDKTLSGIKAVQTLSRLNRAHPKKHDVFVLDFLNDADTIREAFAPFYRATILADETDPNKLHDLQADLDGAQIYSPEQVDDFVRLYLGGADRERLDPILDACVAVYLSQLDEDGQVDFKGKAKAFARTYAFLSSVLPYTNAGWEKRSIFLNFLVPKLPAPQEEDLSKGILDAIDMDSYRVEKRAMQKIILPDDDAEIGPVPTAGGGRRAEPELDRLSNIIKVFNEHFGDIPWQDADRVRQLITETIPARVAADTAYRNAQRHSDKQNARIEHDKALLRVMTAVMKDDTELFKQFMDNEGFKRWMAETVFGLTYVASEAQAP
ncbi:type I restriction endonuclease subunit R [Desulfatitalea alkaliphila]|uniref:Type I restriction endonuclease subunit R n=1 Tax=Desulfatitalea alkaliphila TaxID=2929485 RepID=A0AA41R5A5_9BACT|nr:type I restriction endonuclease subunit R [Desulfatitalea alkaliphila]MCJ8502584.1 type I restriction endonuclease subunit R [Desulfatitalea alkaliphila]